MGSAIKVQRIGMNLIVFLVLAELLAIFFNDVIFSNRTLKSSFTIAQALKSGPYGYSRLINPDPHFYISYADNGAAVCEESYQQFKRNSVFRSVLPLWNPYQACGMPFLANGLTATLFPLTVFLYFLPEKYSWDFYIMLLLFIAGLLTYYFMRLLGYSTLPSLVSATAYMFSGPMILWLVNVTLNTAVMLPLLLICVEKLIRSPGRKWTAITSFAAGLMVVSGHPERVFLAFFTAAMYFTLRLVLSNEASSADKARAVKSAVTALLLGLLLSAVFIMPFTEYLFNSTAVRNAHTGLVSEENPGRAITILAPYFFQPVIMKLNYSRAGWLGGYLGIMVVLLALAGLTARDNRKNNLVFGFIALFILMKCYGIWPVNCIGVLPLFNKVRYSVHYTQDFAFAMAILSGVGLQRFMESRRRFYARMIIPALLTAVLISGWAFYYRMNPLVSSGVNYTFIILLLAAAGCFIRPRRAAAVFLAMLLAGELFHLMPRAHAQKYESFAKVPYMEFIKRQNPLARVYGIEWNLFPNTATGYGIFDLGAYEPLLTKRFMSYMSVFINFPFEKMRLSCVRGKLPDFNSPFLDLLGVEYIVAGTDTVESQMKPDTVELVYNDEARVYRRKTALPRAFIVHKAVFTRDMPEAISLMKANAGKLRDIVFIEAGQKEAAVKDMPARIPRKNSSKADIKKYGPNHVQIETHSDEPGFLVLSDSYYPGWQVFVDGKRERLFAADVMLRAVFLEKGVHSVEFHYRPFSIASGACISLLIFILLILMGRAV